MSETPTTEDFMAAHIEAQRQDLNTMQGIIDRLEREVAELRYVVEKAAEWDADNTDSADLAALGAYARAALGKCHAQGGV